MSLQALLDISASRNMNKDDISEERLDACMDEFRNQIAFYRAYPDIFIDDLTGYSKWKPENGEWKGFKFYYFQRITLRVLLRHRKVYIVFSRGFSKSFLSVLALIIKAVLYPTDSDYYFFVADKNGKTYFSKTYQEHLMSFYYYQI